MVTLPCPVCGERLEIPSEISRFACAHCASELEARHSGGIVTLVKITGSLEGELELLEKELSVLTHQKMVDVPAYVLLRHDFFRIGKLHAWNLTFASETDLEQLFLRLKPGELDKIISFYQENPQSKILPWLLKVKELRQKIAILQSSLPARGG
jgi:tRNA nucleotidyltransferase/poly(A) polymerase